MTKQIDDFCLDIISDIQQHIVEHTLYLNDEDAIDIDTFIAHWLLAEVISMKKKGEERNDIDNFTRCYNDSISSLYYINNIVRHRNF